MSKTFIFTPGPLFQPFLGYLQQAPLSAYQFALTANLYLKLFRVVHLTPSLVASHWTTGKAPPSSSGFQVIRAYQATRPLTNWLPPSPTRRHDLSHLPPRKPSFDAPSPIPRPTGPERPWRTKVSPRRQTASSPPTGQVPVS